MNDGLTLGILSELAFYIAVAVISFPFVIIDVAILRKTSRLEWKLPNKAQLKKTRILKNLIAISALVVVTVSVGCFMQFGLKIQIFEDDLSSLLLFVLAISSLMISYCIFDLVVYKKTKRRNKEKNRSTDNQS